MFVSPGVYHLWCMLPLVYVTSGVCHPWCMSPWCISPWCMSPLVYATPGVCHPGVCHPWCMSYHLDKSSPSRCCLTEFWKTIEKFHGRYCRQKSHAIWSLSTAALVAGGAKSLHIHNVQFLVISLIPNKVGSHLAVAYGRSVANPAAALQPLPQQVHS